MGPRRYGRLSALDAPYPQLFCGGVRPGPCAKRKAAVPDARDQRLASLNQLSRGCENRCKDVT